MSFRPLLALVLGLGLSLTGCIADDAEVDAFDAPGMNAECTDCAGGSGYNGADPMFDCLAGPVRAITGWWGPSIQPAGVKGWQGQNLPPGPGYNYPPNPDLANYRCNGVYTSDPNYVWSQRITDVPDVLMTMAWAAGWQDRYIFANQELYEGNGKFPTNWFTTPLTQDMADVVGATLMTKGNWIRGVRIYNLTTNNGYGGPYANPGDATGAYDILESMSVYPVRIYRRGGEVLAMERFPLYFKSKEYQGVCKGSELNYVSRSCHKDGSCANEVHEEEDVQYYCVTDQKDGEGNLTNQPATTLKDAYMCGDHVEWYKMMGMAPIRESRPVKTFVMEGDISNDVVCNPLH